MKVLSNIEGNTVTLVGINVNGLDIYATYIDIDNTLKVRKYPRNHISSATSLGTCATSLESYILGSNPMFDIAMAASNVNYATLTPHYFYYNNVQDCIISSASIICGSFSAGAIFSIGFYNFSATGAISKYSNSVANFPVTATGIYNTAFTSAIYLPRGRYFVSLLPTSGGIGASVLSRASTPSSTILAFTGVSGVSALPTTESSRTAFGTAFPYIEFL